jgi:hypothetical protein
MSGEMKSQSSGGVLFLGEQVGPFEDKLKSRLATGCLAVHPQISLAYLVRVSYQRAPGANVAICLKGGKDNAQAIVSCIGTIVYELLEKTLHLDILFLSEEQYETVQQIAKPFYVA